MTYMESNDLFTPQNPVDTDALLERAQRYCATAEHCPADVTQLLQRHGATPQQVNEVIGILQAQSYVSEVRYCYAYVHDKVTFLGWGRMKIIAGLRAKHLPDAAIREAMDTMDELAYADNLQRLIKSKRGTDKQKLLRFLLQRGYTFEDIKRYADNALDTDYE